MCKPRYSWGIPKIHKSEALPIIPIQRNWNKQESRLVLIYFLCITSFSKRINVFQTIFKRIWFINWSHFFKNLQPFELNMEPTFHWRKNSSILYFKVDGLHDHQDQHHRFFFHFNNHAGHYFVSFTIIQMEHGSNVIGGGNSRYIAK